MREEFLLVEKFRPKTLVECALPEKTLKQVQTFIEKKNMPNLILTASAGCGKGSLVNAILHEMDADSLFLNCSTEGSIDTLRVKIRKFSSTVSLMGKGTKKIVVMDEIDGASPAFQNGLKSFIEEFSASTTFILTGNSAGKIIPPLHSRCATINFNFSKEEKTEVMKKILRRVFYICEQEGYTYDKKVIAEMVKLYYPDWRKLIHEIQRYGVGGSIDIGILADRPEVKIEQLIGVMKGKKYLEMIKWCSENYSYNIYTLLRNFMLESVSNSTLPNSILIVATWSKESGGVNDPILHLQGCLTDIMFNCEWK